MINEINNCGLVALRNISDLKSVSVRTLINLAEDNGVTLYPYKLTEKDIENVELPAIFHSDNHFVYITNKQDLEKYNLTGAVLFTKKQRYSIINNTYSIKGEWVAAGVASAALTLAAAKWISSNRKEKRAKKARENLVAPFYEVQNEYYQNKNLAAGMAQGGLPAATKDYYTNQSERGLSSGLDAITKSGGSPNDVSKLFQTYDDSIGKISSIDAETHLNNIKYYMNVNKDLAGQKTIQWAIKKQQPYLNTLKELSAAQRAGEAGKNEAYGDAMSALVSFGTSAAGAGGFSGGGGGTGRTSGGGFGDATPHYDSSFIDSGRGDSSFSGRSNSDTLEETPRFDSYTSDPFSNNDADYAQYQQWLQYRNRR